MGCKVNKLSRQLEDKQWEYKYSHYAPVFEYVELLNEVQDPHLSVIVISWRLHPDTLANFISLHKQRESQHFELIFVDNGGRPGEFDALYPYIDTYIRLNVNTGAYLARNVGAIFCKAPILFFLEDDGIADEQLIESHIMIHQRFDVVAVRGIYLYKTDNPLNNKQSHYYLGDRFFPKFSNLEGNTSYSASVFYEVGGWDDQIQFGGGGQELALRIYQLYPYHHKQIYSPISIIYHDYASNEEHLVTKLKRQQESLSRLKSKYDNWLSFEFSWDRYYGDESVLELQANGHVEDQLKLEQSARQIRIRNEERTQNYMIGKVFLYDLDALTNLINVIHIGKKICIFGAGSLGERLLEGLRSNRLRVDCFADNQTSKWSEVISGIPVVSPADINEEYLVFIASAWKNEIAGQLEGMGFRAVDHYLIVI